MAFEEFIFMLEAYGIARVLLPFLLIFTIVFAILQKTAVLGKTNDKPNKRLNVIVALVMGLAVVIPHVLGTYPPGMDVVLILYDALPQISLVLVAILMLMLILGIFGSNITIGGTSASGIILILAIILVFTIFFDAAGWIAIPDFLYFLRDPQIQSTLIVILVFAIVIFFITREDSDDKGKDKGPSFLEQLGNLVEKPGK